MKRFVLLLLILCASASHAINRDSLMVIWNNKSLHDTIRLNAIDKLAWSYISLNPDTAFVLAEQELELAANLGKETQQLRAMYVKAAVWKNHSKYIKAINCLTEILKINGEQLYSNLQGLSYRLLGDIYHELGEIPKAMDYYMKAIKIFEIRKDKYGVASIYILIGNLYLSQDDFAKASEYYSECIKMSEEINDRKLKNICYANIGQINLDTGNYFKALEYFKKDKEILEKGEDKRNLGICYNNLGNVYTKLGEFENAMESFNHSLKIREQIKDKRGIANLSKNIGLLFKEQKQFNKAIIWCEKGLKTSSEIGQLATKRESCKCLYESYKGLGNFVKALKYYERYMELGDSLKKEETAKKLQQMEFLQKIQADSLRQEKMKLKVEIAHEEQMNKQRIQKVILVSAVTVALVMIFGILRRLRYTRKAKTAIEKEKERSENLLLNILPYEVAEELKSTGTAKAKTYSMVSVMFADFKDFTRISEKVSAELLVDEIHHCFSAFDTILEKYKVEKIKTIGDSYMCASGLPVLNYTHATDLVSAAIEILTFIQERKKEKEAKREIPFELRIGIHTGPVVAGIVGVKKFAYDLWGDTVNIAARMEQNSEAGKINISGSTYELVKDKFNCLYRGKIEAKNKGEIEMYFVESIT
jgi:class 3 adenylate cyclase/Tfp pilus assembly protein PilF